MGATFVVFTLAIGQARAGAGALAMPLTILAPFYFLSALLAVSAVLPRVGKEPPVVSKDGKDHSNILLIGRSSPRTEDLRVGNGWVSELRLWLVPVTQKK